MRQTLFDAVRIVTTLATVAAATLQAQTSTTPADRADSLFAAGAWDDALPAYEALVQADSAGARAWFRLGYVLHKVGQFPRAVEAWEHAERAGFAAGPVRYHIASAYARMNQVDEAFLWLKKSAEAGFSQVQAIRNNEDLRSLRIDERFEDMVRAIDRNARPCMYDSLHAQFDFWVGKWNVYTPQGQLAGTNVIEKVIHGCMLLENWTSSSGGEGKSINYYDPAKQTWVQTWVDGSGDLIDIEGVLRDGAMHFVGTHYYRDGRTELFRMSFTPQSDGSVRQFIEQSRDSGETWYVWFDGKYVKAGSRE
jgi:tetratricopeptide (TPR) repeat protein